MISYFREEPTREDQVIIEIDSIPDMLNPVVTHDYTSRFICSAMYQRLNETNCEILDMNSTVYNITLKENYIGTAQELKNCILYHLDRNNKSNYLRQLLMIKNSYSFVVNQSSVNDIGITVKDDKVLEIELEYPNVSFVNTIQNLYIVPMEDGEPIQNGPYILEKVEHDSILLLRNTKFITHDNLDGMKLVDKIIFKLNTNPLNSISMYSRGEIDVTCHTQFLHTNSHLKKYLDFQEKKSPILYTLYISNKRLQRLVTSLINKKSLAKKLKEVVVPLDTLTGDINFSRQESNYLVRDVFDQKVIKIAYANYYPNNYIVENIVRQLNKIGIKCEMHVVNDFRDYLRLNKKDYDISLHLVLPLNNTPVSYARTFLFDINNRVKKQKIIEQVNQVRLEELNNLLVETDNYIPLFMGKSMYMKRLNIVNFYLGTDGYLDLKSLCVKFYNR
ncbi:ABC transporter substrate-binding protein [Bacillus sp. FJAT-45037]|uniref:ABC transporter substrate-binding protein n=1 Tax=Bacillus sp. FJAT-45037 TaxID=2011007 RepID=UPI000C234EFC|nr:ABC transporter substrate-binding protein [Bacillus sp. FJAT-45037]